MSQSDVPDRRPAPSDGEPDRKPDAPSPIDHAPDPGVAPPPDRARDRGIGAGSGIGAESETGSTGGWPPRTSDARRSVSARLALILPVTVGVLIVEGVFAAQGQSGDIISLPAAGVALALLWPGTAWALRSWVTVLMTFVPAIMVTLGAAMVGDLAPGAGAALLAVGAALMAAIIAVRLSTPARRWSPGWFTGPASAGAPPPGSGDQHQHPHRGLPPLDPLGAHFVNRHPTTGAASAGSAPSAADPDETLAPAWDTSGTDVAARDRLVAELCRRGGAAGPTVATVEEFFTGNGDPRSIAPGLRGAVPLGAFSTVLRRLREHRRVSQVLIQLEPLGSGQYPAGEWPVAGSVHVISSLTADEIDALVQQLRPEPVIGPLPVDTLNTGAPAPADSAEYAIWWE